MAETYAKAYKVSLDWLVTGIERRTVPVDLGQTSGIAIRHVPLVPLPDVVGAVKGSVMLDGFPHIPVSIEKPLGSNPLAVRAWDDSMSGAGAIGFAKGTPLVFNIGLMPEPGEYCLATVEAEPSPVFRKYVEEAPGVVRLQPINPDYRTYWIKEGSAGRILGRLMASVNEF
jgi:hypothetical protein